MTSKQRAAHLIGSIVAVLGMGLLFYVYLAVLVYAFSEWGALAGVVALLFPPVDLIMVWFINTDLAWVMVFGLILTFAGGAAMPDEWVEDEPE